LTFIFLHRELLHLILEKMNIYSFPDPNLNVLLSVSSSFLAFSCRNSQVDRSFHLESLFLKKAYNS